jgi:hypothetical protein
MLKKLGYYLIDVGLWVLVQSDELTDRHIQVLVEIREYLSKIK